MKLGWFGLDEFARCCHRLGQRPRAVSKAGVACVRVNSNPAVTELGLAREGKSSTVAAGRRSALRESLHIGEVCDGS